MSTAHAPEQEDLFAPTPRRVRTARQARRVARDQNAPKAPTQRARVLEVITAAGPDGITDEEIQRATGMGANTARPRRVELVKAGTVEEGPIRETASGRAAVAWRVKGGA